MSTLNNPEYLPKDRLKTELKKHGVSFNNNENKDYYVQLYRKHVLKGKARQQQRSEFSSDEELVRHSPRLTRRQQVSTSVSSVTKRKVANVDTYLPQVENLTDQELMDELLQFGEDVGPITATTRNVYLRKLAKLMASKAWTSGKEPSPTEDDAVDSGHHSYVAEWSSGEEEESEEQEEEEPAHLTRSMAAKRAQMAQEKPRSTSYQVKESYRYQQSPAVGRGSNTPSLRERRPQGSTKSQSQRPSTKPSRSRSPQPSTIGSLVCSLLLLVIMFGAAFLVYEHLTCEEGKQSLAVTGWNKVKEFAIKVIPEGAAVTKTTTKPSPPSPKKAAHTPPGRQKPPASGTTKKKKASKTTEEKKPKGEPAADKN